MAQQAENTPFEELLRRLGDVVDQLERGDLPLEKALSAFEEGVQLSRLATARLDEAEKRIEVLLDREDRTQPYELRRNQEEMP